MADEAEPIGAKPPTSNSGTKFGGPWELKEGFSGVAHGAEKSFQSQPATVDSLTDSKANKAKKGLDMSSSPADKAKKRLDMSSSPAPSDFAPAPPPTPGADASPDETPLDATSEAAVAAVARLRQIWFALGVPEDEQDRSLERHALPQDPLAYRSQKSLERSVALWVAAADAVLKREDALLQLALFAEKASVPERLLDRRPPGRSVWHDHVLADLEDPEGGAALTLEGVGTAGTEGAASTTSTTNTAGAAGAAGAGGAGPQAAWLLREAKLRESLQFGVDKAEARLLTALPRLEATGDTMWLQGERYRDKMRHDEQRLLEHAIDQSARNRPESARSRRQGAETARPRSAEPFAPPGRPVVLSPRLANELDATFVLRTAPVPRATPAPPSLQRPSSSQRPSTSGRSTRAAAPPQAGRPMSAIPALPAQSQTSRPPTAPLPRDGPPMTLAYERGGSISTRRFESGRR